ncbi:GNAT family N-acetyltransferase [Enterococcus termitis]|uniref:GNAT family N-acetyltransferase n=1 Tax=Enterococcus termitis TaxID=332950 RepID=UPI0009F61178|nr:N-acetyltransferase [Enterococcus termitis]
MIIRLEAEKDFENLYTFTKEAFKTAKVKSGDEQDFVNRLRQSKEYLPDLAYVAEINDEIVGHVMSTRLYVESEHNEHELLLLAPLTVRLDQRNKGLGGAINE